MINDSVRALVKADSFRPFEIILKTGEIFLVRTSDSAHQRSCLGASKWNDSTRRSFSKLRIHDLITSDNSGAHGFESGKRKSRRTGVNRLGSDRWPIDFRGLNLLLDRSFR